MGLIWWGIVLIAIGLLLALTGFGLGTVFQTLGWIMLVVGVILAIVYAVGGGRRRTVHP